MTLKCVFVIFGDFCLHFAEYNMIKDQPGDSYFVRAMFTRTLGNMQGGYMQHGMHGLHDGSPQLAFKKARLVIFEIRGIFLLKRLALY